MRNIENPNSVQGFAHVCLFLERLKLWYETRN